MNKVDQGKEEYELARLALQEGDLQSAFELVHRATEKDSHNGLFIGLLGEICYAAEAWTDARSFLELALRIDPSLSDSLLFLGHVHRKLDQPNQATQCYKRILLSAPRHLEALMGLGNVSRDLGHLQDALDYYGQCLAIEPKHTVCLINRGLCNLELKRYQEATSDLESCIALAANSEMIYKNLARAYFYDNDYKTAIGYFKKYLDNSPDDYGVRYEFALCYAEFRQIKNATLQLDKLDERCVDEALLLSAANLYLLLKRYEGAKRLLLQFIKIRPNEAAGYLDLAIVLKALGDLDAAYQHTQCALRIEPTNPMNHVVRAMILIAQEQYAAAIQECKSALALDCECFDAYANLAFSQLQSFELDSAAYNFQRALEIKPENADIKYNYGLFLLLTGQLRDGFRYYESRWQQNVLRYLAPKPPGKPLVAADFGTGKNIFIFSEQGLGDTIQFLRFLPQLEKVNRNIFLGLQEPLLRLVKLASFHSPVFSLETLNNHIVPDFPVEHSCGLLSLPNLLGLDQESLPPPIQLDLPTELVAPWEEVFRSENKPLIGLCCQGSKLHANDKNRSISLEELCSYLPSELAYVCLQKEISSEDLDALNRHKVGNYSDLLTDFLDTAALCKVLDLVITVDTSVAHLAGTLGVETWILLPKFPDWRWGLTSEITPWYPTVRLYRQQKRKAWGDVLSKISFDLRYRYKLADDKSNDIRKEQSI